MSRMKEKRVFLGLMVIASWLFVTIPIVWAGPFPAQGREAIRAMYAGFFRAFPTRSIVLRDESRRVYGDTVIYNANWTLVYVDAKGTIKTVYGRTSTANTLVEGRRLIVDQNTSLFPIAGP